MERSGPEGTVRRPLRQGEPPGAVTVESADFPWLHGRFAPEPAFEPVGTRFEAVQATRAAEIDDESFGERFDAAYAPIAEELTFLSPASAPVAEFLLHIDGAGAWFRWSG
ncbi:hypothetical protein [Streptomyces sp. NBC_00096]|uniref:hypothetical protein n=1 Tax=Streptomyces sp. NBC_00096 TaxID=2975650 RepID=UPI00325303DC